MKPNVFRLAAFFITAISTFSCQEAHEHESTNPQDHLIQGTLFVQTAAEYDALCYQAYGIAKYRLEEIIQNLPEKPAIVLDLDETVLDNSPYTGWQIASGEPYKPETWAAWVNLAEAKAVPGSLEFLRYADSLGFTIFYISNRDADQLDVTIKNLDELGVPQAMRGQVLLKEDTGNKDHRRETVQALGFEIVMLIGDNLGDFSSKWDKPASIEVRDFQTSQAREKFGQTYIILPNPVYGTWEGALFEYERNLAATSMDSLRMANIKSAPLLSHEIRGSGSNRSK